MTLRALVRTTWTVPILLLVSACPRFVQPGEGARTPQIALQEPRLEQARVGLTCALGGEGLAGFAGDIIVLEAAAGSGWDAGSVRVQAGGRDLERVETTAQRLRIRMPEDLAASTLTVTADGARAGTTATGVCTAAPRITGLATRPFGTMGTQGRTLPACPPVLESGTAVPAFSGDELVITGEGWDPGRVQVHLGELALPPSGAATPTEIRVRLPAELPPVRVQVQSGAQHSADSVDGVCVTGPGHPVSAAYLGRVETRVSMASAGVAPLLSPACLGVADAGPIVDCQRSAPAFGLAASFTFTALPSVTAPFYSAVFSYAGGQASFLPVLSAVPLVEGATQYRIPDTQPLALPGDAGVVALAMQRAGPLGEGGTTRSVLGSEAFEGDPELLPFAVQGPAGDVVVMTEGPHGAHVLQAGAQHPDPIELATLTGHPGAVGVIDPGYMPEGSIARDDALVTVAMACAREPGDMLRVETVISQPETPERRLQRFYAHPDGGPACPSNSGCTELLADCGDDVTCQIVQYCAILERDRAPGERTPCTSLLACHDDPVDGGCSQQLNSFASCLNDPGCGPLLGCTLRPNGPGCDAYDGGAGARCRDDGTCGQAAACMLSQGGTGPCARAVTCDGTVADGGTCFVVPCEGPTCQRAAHCARDIPPACRPRFDCALTSPGYPAGCAPSYACAEELCARDVFHEVSPAGEGILVLTPHRLRDPLDLGQQGSNLTNICELSPGLATLSGYPLGEDLQAAVVLPASDLQGPSVVMAVTGMYGRTLQVSTNGTQQQLATRAAYKDLLADPSGYAVFAVPQSSALVDVLDRNGALLGNVSLLGPLRDVVPLGGADNVLLQLHYNLMLAEDAAGLTLEGSVRLIDLDVGAFYGLRPAIERDPDGRAAAWWRTVLISDDTHFDFHLQHVALGEAGMPGFGDLRAGPTLLMPPSLGGGPAPVTPWFVDDTRMLLTGITREDGTGFVAVLPAPVDLDAPSMELASVVETEGMVPLAFSPASSLLALRESLPTDTRRAATRFVEVTHDSARLLDDAQLPGGALLQPLPNGSFVGMFFDAPALRVEVGSLLRHVDGSFEYLRLGDSPSAPTAAAVSPDGTRLYLAEQDAIVEVDLGLDEEGNAVRMSVRGRHSVDGTPTLLSIEPTGRRIVYIDQALNLVGLLE